MFFATASYRLMGGAFIFLFLTIFVLKWNLVKNRYIIGAVKLHAISLLTITALYFPQFGKYVFGFETKDDFLKTKVQTYQGIKWVNHNLPKNSRILSTIDQKYYFDFPVYSTVEYPLIMGEDVRKFKTIEDLYLFIKGQDITHLFIADTGMAFYGDFLKLLSETADKYGKVIYQEENVTIRGTRHPLIKQKFGKLTVYKIY